MKTLNIFATIAVIVLFVAASCKKTEGNWKKMKLDKTEVVFNSEGGEEIVTVLNYSALWLGGAETYRFVNAEWQVDRLFSPQNSDVAITQDVLEGRLSVSVICFVDISAYARRRTFELIDEGIMPFYLFAEFNDFYCKINRRIAELGF